MNRTFVRRVLLASSLFLTAIPACAADITLTIESWRNDDLSIWQDKIIPAFQAVSFGKVEVKAAAEDFVNKAAGILKRS